VQKVGFTDEVDSAQLQAVADTTAQRCTDLASFVLHIGWLAASEGAIRFTVLPVEPVIRVRQAVLETLTDIGIPTTDQAAKSTTFWPHVSIAYCNASTPAGLIVERMAPLRALAPAKVHIRKLDLVELRRNNRVYRWETLKQAELKQ
jgi:2'-5' RNA ligase